MALLNNVELPALEDGCVNKKLLVSSPLLSPMELALMGSVKVKADERTKVFLDAYAAQKMRTEVRALSSAHWRFHTGSGMFGYSQWSDSLAYSGA